MAKRRAHGEGSVSRRADGRWIARLELVGAGGQRRRAVAYAGTQRAAFAKLAELRRQRDAGRLTVLGRVTVGAFLQRWLADVQAPHREPATVARQQSVLTRYLLPAFGPRPLRALTAAEIQAEWARERQAGLSARTIRIHHSTLHNAYSVAVRWGLVAHNPTADVVLPRLERKAPRVFTPRQAQQFLQVVRGDRWEALYICGITTGMRIGECLGLQWQAVDLDARLLRVERKLLYLGTARYEAAPKTDSGLRTIPLHPLAVDALRRHQTAQQAMHAAWGARWERPDLVFPSPHGRPQRANTITSYYLPRLLARHGLPPLTFHGLRHAMASIMLRQREDINVVQQLLGHASPQVTREIYRHVFADEGRAAIDRLGDFLQGDEA